MSVITSLHYAQITSKLVPICTYEKFVMYQQHGLGMFEAVRIQQTGCPNSHGRVGVCDPTPMQMMHEFLGSVVD